MAVAGASPRPLPARAAVAIGAGALVSVGLGTYGRVHDPTGEAIFTLFFKGMVNLKVWFATAALAFGAFQVLSALRLYGKVRWPATTPSWLGDAHRLSGTLAFLCTLPVAYHCLWALGFESHTGETRRFIHSVAGCAFYGVFTIKVLSVRARRLPNWVLPVVGGTLFGILAVLWATSSLWFFRHVGFPEV